MRISVTILLFLFNAALQAERGRAPLEVKVAKDGSGDYPSIQAAMMKPPTDNPDSPVIIHAEPVVYLQKRN